MAAQSQSEQPDLQSEARKRKRFAISLAAILAFAMILRLVHLGTPPKFFFDEVYHGFTATQYLHGNVESYNPFAKPPQGVAFEWTHPPLAKLLMAGMMQVFGENAFGWRVGSAIFGTAAIGLTALIALELFASPFLALLSAALLSLEGLFFVQSRIAMNDAYLVCFALASTLLYLRWKKSRKIGTLYASGAFLGLAAASKWTTLYVIIILMIDLGFVLRDRLKGPVQTKKKGKYIAPPPPLPWLHLALAFVALPAVIYLASYAQYFILGGTWNGFLEIQYQMRAYHMNLKAQHAYQSAPWQWIFNLRPVWMWVEYSPGHIANIYNIGNSVILISGFVAALWTLFKDKDRSEARRFLLIAYFMLWLPWSISPRIMLFYHYTPALPFLCILLARGVLLWMERRPDLKSKPLVALLVASVFWFALFFPHMTGIAVPTGLAQHVYFLLPSWK